MQRELLIGLGCGLLIGTWLSFAALPGVATAQGTNGPVGLYQIQVGSGLSSPGTSSIWRVNTATGALEFCTFSNVNISGSNRLSCQGNPGPTR
jgi:hypothetical protein